MKDFELKKLIVGKDLTKDETIAEINSALNNEFNTLLVKKEDSLNAKIDNLKKENESLKAQAGQVEDLNKQLDNAKAENINLQQRSYVYKNVGKVADEDMDDLLTLTKARIIKNDKLKFEDVVKEVAEKRGFVGAPKGDEKKPEGTIPPSPRAKATGTAVREDNKFSKEEFLDWWGKK